MGGNKFKSLKRAIEITHMYSLYVTRQPKIELKVVIFFFFQKSKKCEEYKIFEETFFNEIRFSVHSIFI